MTAHAVIVDIGKTHSKLGLWTSDGERLRTISRENRSVETKNFLALDSGGVDDWLMSHLSDLSGSADIEAIVPVAHGAAAAVIRDGQLAHPPMDYEAPIPPTVRAQYDDLRDPFAQTGSPRLPDGLNLGAQLHYLQHLHPELFDADIQLLTWPQYWAWRLCGVAACERTSLGCHTDLWAPTSDAPSPLAQRQGWADQLAPLRSAGERLGALDRAVAQATRLPQDTSVYCGIHDSNAALLAASAYPELDGQDFTVISTGTWFVTMRRLGRDTALDIASLPEARDCLVNVDASGDLVPSARFMGGREIALLTDKVGRIDDAQLQDQMLQATAHAVNTHTMALPCHTPGTGPFPASTGRWRDGTPSDAGTRLAATSLYAALMAETCLSLVGARGRVLIEGRFAATDVFVRALATLRPDLLLYRATVDTDVSFGALRLVYPNIRPRGYLNRIKPLDVDLAPYRACWLDEIERARANV